MRLFRKSKKTLPPLKTYSSIHNCPIKVWFDIHKTSDCLLLLTEPQEITPEQTNELWSIWDKIYNEYIAEFGFTEEFLADLNEKIELANYKAEFVITGDRYFRTMIRVHEERMKVNSTSEKEPPKLEVLLAKMSKHYGFKLSSRELTIAEYYSYLKSVTNG